MKGDYDSITLCVLRLDKGLYEFVCSLSVEGQSVMEGQEIRTLLQECLLQTYTTSMEVLLSTEAGESSC